MPDCNDASDYAGLPRVEPYPALTPAELAMIRLGCCPDCGGGKLLKGPKAGLSVNVKCATPDCGSRFNVSIGIIGEARDLLFAERIGAPRPERKE
jgi:hypothetical protein